LLTPIVFIIRLLINYIIFNTQQMKNIIIDKLNLGIAAASVITIASCSVISKNYTKKWSGSDVPGHTFASFEQFNGKQEFEIKHPGNDPFYVKYITAVGSGKLHMEIKSGAKSFLSKDLSGNMADSVYVNNESGGKVKLIFEASNAEGSFDIRY